MTPILRKPLFITHVTASVGWMGAVAMFLALAVIALHSADPASVRGTYLVMEPAAWYVLVPLAAATLVSGVIQTALLQLRLFTHYWVLFKLVMAVFITMVLVLYMDTFSAMARAAADTRLPLDAVRSASPLIHAALALIVLLAATVLAVYKPRGHIGSTPLWAKLYGAIVALVIAAFLALLLAKGPGSHGPGRHVGAWLNLPMMASLIIGPL